MFYDHDAEMQRIDTIYPQWRSQIVNADVYLPQSVVDTDLHGLDDLSKQYDIPEFQNMLPTHYLAPSN